MARISSYIIDTAVTLLDKWIGTDSAGGVTKNFTAQSIANLFNEKSAIGVTGQNNFFFQTNLAGGRNSGTISFTAGGGDSTSLSSITTLKISENSSSGNLILQYLQTLVSEYIIIAQINDLNKFGIYKLDSLNQDLTETSFYNANFTLVQSNGSIAENEYYGIAIYPVPSASSGDLNFTYNQIAASASWNITHNLGKNPSVSIVDSGGNWVVGDVLYINNNELTINFNSAFSGTAYLN